MKSVCIIALASNVGIVGAIRVNIENKQKSQNKLPIATRVEDWFQENHKSKIEKESANVLAKARDASEQFVATAKNPHPDESWLGEQIPIEYTIEYIDVEYGGLFCVPAPAKKQDTSNQVTFGHVELLEKLRLFSSGEPVSIPREKKELFDEYMCGWLGFLVNNGWDFYASKDAVDRLRAGLTSASVEHRVQSIATFASEFTQTGEVFKFLKMIKLIVLNEK